ncbi:MAG TPA: peptide chain release factor N(5)-glutamine methyltransferase [Paenalcaligenes sp.]|nr:peptide chain release factor N(5)-glutamine methyltransferase [Paenalcaligenes sp.]
MTSPLQTIQQAQRQSPLPLLEQHMLWGHVLGVSRAWLIAHDRDPIAAADWQHYHDLQARRLEGTPMAYLLGWREFMGHRFEVGPGVLIPRPETEILVTHVLQNVLPRFQHPRILDLGTGSGIVAISLALECPQATVVATDVCPTALSWAKKNARTLCGGNIDFLQGSWYDALSAQDTFDVIVSNPPYIAAADVHLAQGDLRAEPTQALTDGQDGLQFLQAIIAGAPQFLRSEGALWVEHGWNQHQAVRELMLKEGFSEVRSIHDLASIPRISGGTINL